MTSTSSSPRLNRSSYHYEYFLEPAMTYESPRTVKIKNWKLGLLYRCTQFAALLWICIGMIYFNQGYAIQAPVNGSVYWKIKGTGSTGDANNWRNSTVWDSNDLTYPTSEDGAAFLATQVIHTYNQKRGVCDPNPSNKVKSCTTDSDCKENTFHFLSQGIYTGKCGKTWHIDSKGRNRTYCQVYSWCPLENDDVIQENIVNNVFQFSMFIRNDIEVRFERLFSKGNSLAREIRSTSIFGGDEVEFGKQLFWIYDIVNISEPDEESRNIMLQDGGMILVDLEWDISLPWDYIRDKDNKIIEKTFKDEKGNTIKQNLAKKAFKMHYKRLDDNFPGIIPGENGYSFRRITYEVDENNSSNIRRHITKYVGLRIIFRVSGNASKFDIYALAITLGAGLSYLAIGSFLAELALRRLLYLKLKKIDKKRKLEKYDTKEQLQIHKNILEAQKPTSSSVFTIRKLAEMQTQEGIEKKVPEMSPRPSTVRTMAEGTKMIDLDLNKINEIEKDREMNKNGLRTPKIELNGHNVMSSSEANDDSDIGRDVP